MSASKSIVPEQSPYAQKPWLKHYDFWIPERINYPRQSVYQVLNLSASLFADRPATVFLGAKMTYSEIKAHADRLATALSRLGIGRGDRVGIMLPNCPQYIISFYAIVRLGAIVTNVNPIYTPREVEMVAKDSGMRAMITLDALAGTVLSIRGASQIEHVITTGIGDYSGEPRADSSGTPGTLSFSEMIAGVGAAELPYVVIDAEEDVAVLQYTGGTTGLPKAAMLTHFNLFSATIQCAMWGHYISKRGEERFLMVIPYFHIYALITGVVYGVWMGAMQIIVPKYEVNQMLAIIKEHEPTYFPAVPTLFISLLNHPEAAGSGLDRIRRFNSGSAPLPLEVIEQFERLSGAMLYEGYGMTETSALAHTTATLAKRKPGSIGFPVPDTDCKIVDLETGEREAAVGEEGELVLRGPQVMKGYWRNAEETAAALRDGWLFTGDVARMDEDGYFYIVQRKKDMIIVSGFNVYPNEVEEVIFTHPAVKEAAVIGVADDYRGEAVKAFIVLKEGREASEEDIFEFCSARLARYKVPSLVEFAGSLPKSGVGKVLRRELREMEDARRGRG
ncbi:MAG TPA: long-chain fatty acid--CoA ligase [Blastocatellia bacterium]|nr:long-chain fatty acid--CoA ligase [Blastocatellia bacterium]